nr:hypothetical protein Iba_chr05fCG9870 [Ipomoea batatas]GME02449.1 hypothetical protein Iba_scaffold17CG0020 [Ipomoea batatas]
MELQVQEAESVLVYGLHSNKNTPMSVNKELLQSRKDLSVQQAFELELLINLDSGCFQIKLRSGSFHL